MPTPTARGVRCLEQLTDSQRDEVHDMAMRLDPAEEGWISQETLVSAIAETCGVTPSAGAVSRVLRKMDMTTSSNAKRPCKRVMLGDFMEYCAQLLITQQRSNCDDELARGEQGLLISETGNNLWDLLLRYRRRQMMHDFMEGGAARNALCELSFLQSSKLSLHTDSPTRMRHRHSISGRRRAMRSAAPSEPGTPGSHRRSLAGLPSMHRRSLAGLPSSNRRSLAGSPSSRRISGAGSESGTVQERKYSRSLTASEVGVSGRRSRMSTAGSEGRKSQPGCDEASSAGDSGTKPRMSLTGTGAVSRKSQQGGSTQQPLVATSTGHEHGGQEAVAATQGSQNMEALTVQPSALRSKAADAAGAQSDASAPARRGLLKSTTRRASFQVPNDSQAALPASSIPAAPTLQDAPAAAAATAAAPPAAALTATSLKQSSGTDTMPDRTLNIVLYPPGWDSSAPATASQPPQPTNDIRPTISSLSYSRFRPSASALPGGAGTAHPPSRGLVTGVSLEASNAQDLRVSMKSDAVIATVGEGQDLVTDGHRTSTAPGPQLQRRASVTWHQQQSTDGAADLTCGDSDLFGFDGLLDCIPLPQLLHASQQGQQGAAADAARPGPAQAPHSPHQDPTGSVLRSPGKLSILVSNPAGFEFESSLNQQTALDHDPALLQVQLHSRADSQAAPQFVSLRVQSVTQLPATRGQAGMRAGSPAAKHSKGSARSVSPRGKRGTGSLHTALAAAMLNGRAPAMAVAISRALKTVSASAATPEQILDMGLARYFTEAAGATAAEPQAAETPARRAPTPAGAPQRPWSVAPAIARGGFGRLSAAREMLAASLPSGRTSTSPAAHRRLLHSPSPLPYRSYSPTTTASAAPSPTPIHCRSPPAQYQPPHTALDNPRPATARGARAQYAASEPHVLTSLPDPRAPAAERYSVYTAEPDTGGDADARDRGQSGNSNQWQPKSPQGGHVTATGLSALQPQQKLHPQSPVLHLDVTDSLQADPLLARMPAWMRREVVDRASAKQRDHAPATLNSNDTETVKDGRHGPWAPAARTSACVSAAGAHSVLAVTREAPQGWVAHPSPTSRGPAPIHVIDVNEEEPMDECDLETARILGAANVRAASADVVHSTGLRGRASTAEPGGGLGKLQQRPATATAWVREYIDVRGSGAKSSKGVAVRLNNTAALRLQACQSRQEGWRGVAVYPAMVLRPPSAESLSF